MKKLPHPLMKMIGKKVLNIKRGELDGYGNGEHVGEVYQFEFDDNTSLTISLDDPGESCYSHIFEEEVDLSDSDLKWHSKLKDLSKCKVENYDDED